MRRPGEAAIREWLDALEGQPFSYPHVGFSRETAAGAGVPGGYILENHRIRLGSGAAAFARARAALRGWEMFHVGWLDLCWPSAEIVPNTTVGILIRTLGFWSLACRVVYVVDDAGEVEGFGLAYGTLRDHAESGEERFTVEWRHEDDSVWYDLLAFSRPGRLLARLGYPYARHLQHRFAADSLRAMKRAAA